MPRTRRWLDAGRGEQGSVLLASLVVILVAAILGLALYKLGVVESRLVYTSQGDARAFEIAQTGVERALFKLQDTYNHDGQSWVSPSSTTLCTGGGHAGCSDSQFYPAAGGYISSVNFDSGSYTIEFKQVTAQTLSIPCKTGTPGVTSDVDGTKKICDDLIFVRVTGTLAPSATAPDTAPGYTAKRTIQLLAQATLVPGTCLICGGLTGAAGTGTPINGNVRIAGSILIAGKQGTASLTMGGGAGQTNSYAELDAQSLARVPQLPLVCPFGATCSDSSSLVESLGATLKVKLPTDVPAVTLSGTADLGQNGNQTYTADSTRKGKGPLDAILVADGCVMPCTDNFTGVTLNSNTFVDDNNITKPYQGPTVPFPLLTGAWQVFGVPYDHLACPAGSSCTAPTTPPTAPSGTSEFFVSRAANVMVSGNCVPSCDPIINSLGSSTGLTDATATFSVMVRFYDQSNNYMKAQICYQRPALTTPFCVTHPTNPACVLPANTLEFGQPILNSSAGAPTCDTPAPSSAPLFLYFPSATPSTTGFNVQRVGGPTDYNYRGSAIVVTNGLVQIEERLQTCQTASGAPCYNSHGFGGPDLFTQDSSLTVMTWGGAGCTGCGNMNLAKNTSNVDRIMGLFYAGCDPTDSACATSKGMLTSQKQTNVVGTALGYRLCFAGGSAPCSSGGNVPSFFQVIPDKDNLIATISVPGSGSFTVLSVPRYWVECKRTLSADGSYASLPTGLCPYTP